MVGPSMTTILPADGPSLRNTTRPTSRARRTTRSWRARAGHTDDVESKVDDADVESESGPRRRRREGGRRGHRERRRATRTTSRRWTTRTSTTRAGDADDVENEGGRCGRLREQGGRRREQDGRRREQGHTTSRRLSTSCKEMVVVSGREGKLC